jgi:phage baseplate assembly protein W
MAQQFIARQPDYKDLDLDFLANPTTKDIVKKVGVEALKRSVRNLILTNFYDRPFRSYIGSNAQKLLFDNMNPLTANFLKDAIKETIENYEPRVSLRNVTVQIQEDNNGYIVAIDFTIKNNDQPVNISVFLERIR